VYTLHESLLFPSSSIFLYSFISSLYTPLPYQLLSPFHLSLIFFLLFLQFLFFLLFDFSIPYSLSFQHSFVSLFLLYIFSSLSPPLSFPSEYNRFPFVSSIPLFPSLRFFIPLLSFFSTFLCFFISSLHILLPYQLLSPFHLSLVFFLLFLQFLFFLLFDFFIPLLSFFSTFL